MLMLAFILVVGSSSAQEQDQKRRGGPKHGKEMQLQHKHKMAELLDLTEQQEKELEQIRIQYQKKQMFHQLEVKGAKLEVQKMLLEDQLNEKELNKVVEQIAVLESEIMKNRVLMLFETKSVLTPEQQMKAGRMLQLKEGRGRRY